MSGVSVEFLARILAGRMVNSLVLGMAVAVLAWTLLRITGRRNSSTRFAVWFGALITLAGLPLMGAFSPAEDGVRSGLSLALPESWAVYLLVGWGVIAAFAQARVLIGFLQVMKLRRSCVVVNVEALDPILRNTLREEAHGRRATLCVSSRLQVPTALGFFRPLVAIPAWAMEELSAGELNAILIHELAHVRRWDDWSNLLQKVVRAVFFFHPAAWWIDRQLSLEREMACDDEVLSRTENPKAYARCLVAVAEKSFLRRSFALAQAAVNHVRQTSLRVTQILDGKRSGATRIWWPALYATAALAIACVVVSARMPELVTFQDSQRLQARALRAVAPPVSTPVVKPEVVRAKFAPAALKTNKIPTRILLASGLPALHKVRPEESFGGVAVSFPEAEPGAGSMLIVVHQREMDPQGSMFWAVYVWQVNLRGPNPLMMGKTAPAKTT